MASTRLAFQLCFILAFAGCTSTEPPPSDVLDAPAAFADEYRIGIGDTLQVDVWQHPDLSVGVPVRPDGKITVPVAGDIAVGGMTPEVVADSIETILGEYVREPVVTVTVTGMGSNEYLSRVRVTGAVGAPTSVPYRPGMTVLDVILEAGGVTEFANSRRTRLFRSSGDRIDVRLDRILESGDMSTNYTLRPGDVITVPQRMF
jgi:polysaccharide export outer membrane protein